MKYLNFMVAALCLLLMSCASLQKEDPAIQLLINVGTIKAIEAVPVDERLERAERLVELSDKALVMLSDQNVALAAVYEAVTDEIRWDQLTPGDQILYRSLLSTLAMRIQEHIDADALDEQSVATTLIAVGWVRQSALNYIAVIDG